MAWALVVGDCACVPDPRTASLSSDRAARDVRGKILAPNLVATVRGGQKRRFFLARLGLLASIGRRTGVANTWGVNFVRLRGLVALAHGLSEQLPRFEKKLLSGWTGRFDLAFSKDIVQFLTHRSTSVSHTDDAAHRSEISPRQCKASGKSFTL